MKPPAAGAKAAVTSSSSRQGGGSHIPLPLRKGSTKLDKTQDGETECGEDCDRPRASRGRRGNQERSCSSGGKMSLLGGTSFCCASGQKDDIRDSQSIPAPQKRRIKNSVVKREAEGNAPESAASTPPVIAKKHATPKGRRPKIENDTIEDSLSKDSRQHAEEFGCKSRAYVEEKNPLKSSASSHPPLQDNRLKFSDNTEKRRSSTTAQQHPRPKDVCSSAGQRKDSGNDPEMTAAGKQQKYTEVLRKLRKDPAHCTPNNIMVLNVENKLYEKGVTNDKKVNEPLVEISPAGEATDSNDRLKSNSEDNQIGFNVQKVSDHSASSSGMILKESVRDTSLSPGHADELNCPCCDTSDIASSEILECTSEDCGNKDVLEKDAQHVSSNLSLKDCKGNCEAAETEALHIKKEDAEGEVGALREELKQEKLRLQNQQERVHQLEEEVKVMQQLKRELSKEQRLRKEAEETLLEILNRGSNLDQDQQRLLPLESQDCATDCKKHESGRPAVPDTEEDNSSLLLGYESRIRRYQLYISKLEKDNLTLIRELQQFKDLSPCSQQEQAKALLGKVTQLERDNQQQQVQYECCLDEVANRLVHTLLAQKHLEEECNTLHARVEQLENDNQKLLAIVHSDEGKVKTLRTSSRSDTVKVAELSSSDCLTKESFSRIIDVKKSLMKEPAKCASEKHVKTCKVPPTRHQKTLIPEDRVSSLNFNALSASKIASSFDKAGLKAHYIHPRILNNQIPSQVNENVRPVPTDASVCPIQKNVTKATTKCSSPNSVPNSSRLRSPTIHLSFKDKASSATDDTRISDVKRKKLNRAVSEREMKELQLHGRYPNTSLDKCPRSERNYLHSESSIHLGTALQPRQKNTLLVDESFSDSDEVFIYNDSPKNFSYEAFCMFPSSRDQTGIYLEDNSSKVFSPVHETDNSVSNDTVHRTRDEGYSTMSSDLQPDSAADTTVSEQDDHSATYIVSESGQRCSDDSITECLDGSMSSSSDSGFGPLNCVTGDLLSSRFPNASLNSEGQLNSENSTACVLVNGRSTVQPAIHEVELQGKHMQSTPEAPFQEITTIIPNGVDRRSSEELSHSTRDIHQSLDISTQSCDDSSQRHSTQTEISDFCEDSSNSEATTIIPPHKIQKANQECQSISCHLNELIDPPLYSEFGELHATSEGDLPPCCPAEDALSPNEEKIVLTAEKATLTEPEELMWREKALAQYIDESIWSLYSSESDIQIKYSPETFHNLPLEEIPSRPHCLPRSKTHNCITLSEELEVDPNSKNSLNDTEVTDVFKDNPGMICADNAVIELFNNNVYDDSKVSVSQHSLERVASDTVLHLKTTFHELETSMRSRLKTSKDITNKNIPLVHHLSISDISNRDLSLTPDKDIHLEKKFLEKSQKQELTVSNLWWPSPTDVIKSSSLSSLQSSLSYQAVSDEMEDDDIHHISRKGSQDPDLSSASDTDYVNLDHKDFVEQWLQKEITEKHASTNEEGCNSENTKKTTVLRNNVPRYYMKKSPKNFSANQNESNGVPLDHRPNSEDDHFLILSESRGAHAKLQSSSLETTPNSLENYYMGEISALYADACASYVEDNYQSKGFAVSSEVHYPPYSMKNLSPGIYKNLEAENSFDEFLQCPPSEDCDSQSLEPEVKAFNSDFYRLCNLGSLRSLDSYSVGKTDGTVNQDVFQKQLLLSPKFARFNLRKTQELVNQKASSKNPENNSTQSEQTQPVRPTSFTSPLVPCDRKFHFFSKKDSNCTKCDATNVPETTRLFQCSLHPSSHCNCERKSAHLPCPDDSLPAKKPVVNANNIQVHSKLPIRKVTAFNKAYPSDNQESHVLVSPQKKSRNSPQHRIPSRDLLLDYRTDEVSKRQQSRRERWNARRNRMKEGCGTAWIHLQTSADFADPNMRESLLDSVVATSSSDSSSSEDENEYLLSHNSSQLQRICQEKRQKAKAPGKGNNLGLLPRRRTSILNCRDIYYRYGQQEQEAIACFDFLEDIPTTSESGSLEILQKQTSYNANTVQYNQGLGAKGRLKSAVYDDLPSTNCSLPSRPSQFLNFSSRLRLPGLWNKPLSHNMSTMTISSQDCEFLDHISLSDSCAESYSSTPDSFEDTSAS